MRAVLNIPSLDHRPTLHYAFWRLRLADASTQTSRAERDALARHVATAKRVVEIGVWHGVTTKRLKASMAPDGELWAVDPYPRGRFGLSFQQLIAHSEVGSIENGQVRWVRMTGAEAGACWVQERRPPADFLFIDGDHSWQGIEADWGAWSGLVAMHGKITLHDSRSTPERPIDDAGSVRFTRAVIHADERFRIVEEVDSLTVLERVK